MNENQIPNRRSQKATIFVLLALVLILAAGLGAYMYQQQKIDDLNMQLEVEKNKAQAPKEKTQSTSVDLVEYTNAEYGVTFSYPKTWVKVECDDRPAIVYLASDDRGVGMNNGESILCGGGTDIPAQVEVMLDSQDGYQGEAPGTTLTIDGVEATKYVDTSGGQELSPEGFETTTYVIPRDSKNLIFVYHQWPESQSSDYDTSAKSKEQFVDMVESLRLN